MSRLLFQGVPGVADISESLRSISNGRHPERAQRVEGPAVAFPSVPAGAPGKRSLLAGVTSPYSLVPGIGVAARDADTLHEECGVVAIHNHAHAAHQAYLSLYALQHRGQESAGIATADGAHLANIKGMGLVSEIFTDDVLAKLPGHMAIGHTRYSTTGDSALLN